jgi:hypothetical protein
LAISNISSARKPNFRGNTRKRSNGRACSNQLQEAGCSDTPAAQTSPVVQRGHSLGATMRPWNTARAVVYGAALGFAAAAVKSFAPWSEPYDGGLAMIEEFAGATLAFALLCGVAAALRNFVARRLLWRELR